nr:hypothetical protein [Tanacetum cinerariifolium]
MPDSGTIDEYASKLLGIASKSAMFGKVISEHKLLKKFLISLPKRFKEEDKANDAQENLLYARTEYSNGNNDSNRGSGHGSFSQGHGQASGRRNTRNHGQCDSSKNRKDNEQKGK